MIARWFLVLSFALLAPFTHAQTAEKVLGRWSDGWYVGTVIQMVGDRHKVLFDDGDEALLPKAAIRPIDWTVGTRLQCNFKGTGLYFWGVIQQKTGGRVAINYDDGDRETTVIGRCRVPLK